MNKTAKEIIRLIFTVVLMMTCLTIAIVCGFTDIEVTNNMIYSLLWVAMIWIIGISYH